MKGVARRPISPLNRRTHDALVRIVVVLTLVAGLGMSIYGALGYQALTRMSYPAPTSKFGLVLFSSPWTRMERNGQVEIKISEIETITNTARLSVVCSFGTNDETNTRLIFGVQSPYNFSALVVTVNMQSKSTGHGQGGGLGNSFFLAQSESADKKNGLFYFWAIIERHDFLLTLYDSFTFNVTMNLQEVLYRKSYTTFGLITQFDSAFPTIPAAGLPHEIAVGTFSFFTPVSSQSYALEIAQPERSRVESTPAADAIVFAGARTWYLWTLPEKRSALDYFGMAVLTDFEMLDLVEQRETYLFQDGLLLGVGLPAILTGTLELLRELKERAAQTELVTLRENDQRRSKSRRRTRT